MSEIACEWLASTGRTAEVGAEQAHGCSWPGQLSAAAHALYKCLCNLERPCLQGPLTACLCCPCMSHPRFCALLLSSTRMWRLGGPLLQSRARALRLAFPPQPSPCLQAWWRRCCRAARSCRSRLWPTWTTCCLSSRPPRPPSSPPPPRATCWPPRLPGCPSRWPSTRPTCWRPGRCRRWWTRQGCQWLLPVRRVPARRHSTERRSPTPPRDLLWCAAGAISRLSS